MGVRVRTDLMAAGNEIPDLIRGHHVSHMIGLIEQGGGDVKATFDAEGVEQR